MDDGNAQSKFAISNHWDYSVFNTVTDHICKEPNLSQIPEWMMGQTLFCDYFRLTDEFSIISRLTGRLMSRRVGGVNVLSFCQLLIV